MRWRRIAGAALTCLGLMASISASSAAAASQGVYDETTTGTLTIAWTGEPSLGCAAAGACGVSGALEMLPGGEEAGTGPVPLELADFNAAARVTMQSPDGSTTICDDLVPVDVTLSARHVGAQLRAIVNPEQTTQLPSAGHCAGPTAADLSRFSLPARRVGRHSYDLSGTSTLTAGAYAVTISSTVRVLVSEATGSSTSGSSGSALNGGGFLTGSSGATTVRVRHGLQEYGRVTYRITSVSGALTTDFTAMGSPLCLPLGSCGLSGELTQTFRSAGTFAFSGARLVAHRVASATALADLGAGRLALADTFDETSFQPTESATVSGPGGYACADQLAELPFSGVSRAAGRGAVTLELSYFDPRVDLGGAGADGLRTRCPGPSGADIVDGGNSPMATATVTAAQLGAPSLTVTFRPPDGFAGADYSGRRSGAIVMTLTRVRAAGGTRRVITLPGGVVL